MKTLSLLGLLLFGLQSSGAIEGEPSKGLATHVYFQCCGEDSVIVLDHAGLRDSTIRVFSPTGKLVYHSRTSERTDKENIMINENGAYWIMCSNGGEVRTLRLLAGKDSEGA